MVHSIRQIGILGKKIATNKIILNIILIFYQKYFISEIFRNFSGLSTILFMTIESKRSKLLIY